MNDDDQTLVSRLFALLTAKAEDAATLAVEGQDRIASSERLTASAGRIQSLGEEIALVAVTIERLLRSPSIDQPEADCAA